MRAETTLCCSSCAPGTRAQALRCQTIICGVKVHFGEHINLLKEDGGPDRVKVSAVLQLAHVYAPIASGLATSARGLTTSAMQKWTRLMDEMTPERTTTPAMRSMGSLAEDGQQKRRRSQGLLSQPVWRWPTCLRELASIVWDECSISMTVTCSWLLPCCCKRRCYDAAWHQQWPPMQVTAAAAQPAPDARPPRCGQQTQVCVSCKGSHWNAKAAACVLLRARCPGTRGCGNYAGRASCWHCCWCARR